MKEPKKQIKITPAKGRPMLYWAGKKPVGYVKGYPAQLIEAYDPYGKSKFHEIPKYEELEKNWHNLLFEGDNKDVLAMLLENGFRGKIDLIYIDPPFASNADYVRKIQLRGLKNLGQITEDNAPFLQQVMYEDMWKRDEYFQFMYERLLLMKELLNEAGSIYTHFDYRMVHYVKLIMDEVFGQENCLNEIIWYYRRWNIASSVFARSHDNILFYVKALGQHIFNNLYIPKSEKSSAQGKAWKSIIGEDGIRRSILTGEPTKGVPMPDTWEMSIINPVGIERTTVSFATQKPESLLERIIKASSNENSLILDCFIGSGTTAAVAQKLGRRWIGVDINKGALQITAKRIRNIVEEELKKNNKLGSNHKYFTFATYKVNNYDLKLLQTEAKELAIEHLGIERTKTDRFFDGKLGSRLVKIIDFNHPLTPLDLQIIADELKKRPKEDRDISVVCVGKELNADAWLKEWNKKAPINKIAVIDLKTDPKNGGFLIHEPAKVRIKVKRNGIKAKIEIENFISPTIAKRLDMDMKLLKAKITDFRSMIDCVLIDPDYDGKVFKTVHADIPIRKDDFIKGQYEISLPKSDSKIAIKIVDMLGEEVLEVF